MAHQRESSHPFASCVVLHCLSGPSWRPAFSFKSQPGTSSSTPFPTSARIGYTCQHSRSFQPFRAAVVSLGRRGPMIWSGPLPGSCASAITWGCLPAALWIRVTPISRAPIACGLCTLYALPVFWVDPVLDRAGLFALPLISLLPQYLQYRILIGKDLRSVVLPEPNRFYID